MGANALKLRRVYFGNVDDERMSLKVTDVYHDFPAANFPSSLVLSFYLLNLLPHLVCFAPSMAFNQASYD
jgi:hypothetical protein